MPLLRGPDSLAYVPGYGALFSVVSGSGKGGLGRRSKGGQDTSCKDARK